MGNTVGSECLELLGRPRPQHGAQVSGSIIAAERRKQGLGVSSPCMSLAAVDSALWKAEAETCLASGGPCESFAGLGSWMSLHSVFTHLSHIMMTIGPTS